MEDELKQIRRMSALMGWAEAHPRLVAVFLRPLASLPFLSSRLGIVVRATMGMGAFDMHRIDRTRGRISIGKVDEVLTGSKLIQAMHTQIAQRVGEAEKNRIMYELGEATCRWEASEALSHGEWAPAALVPLIQNATVLDRIKTEPEFARFFCRTMNVMARVIAMEGGWGNLHFELDATRLQVRLNHSQESHWMGPAQSPVCHYFAGIVGGYASTLTGRHLIARETSCVACGGQDCLFVLEEAIAP